MFHPLRVARIDRLTDDAVAVTFAVPPPLRAAFRFTPGQHLTLRHHTAGTELRRNYSLCSPAPAPAPAAAKSPDGPADPADSDDPADPDDGPAELTVGIRHLPGGQFSAYAVQELAPGDTVEVMPPAGRFTLAPRPGHFAAVVGGSGITPVLSMAASLLKREPNARFTLLRSDRTAGSAMFLEEVADLKDRHPERLQLVQTLSREERQAGPDSGRLDAARLGALLPTLLPVAAVDGWYLCGPPGLVDAARAALRALDVPGARVHAELFHADDTTPPAPAPPDARPTGGVTVTATLDGRAGSWSVPPGETLLQAVLRHRPDAPYACRGGVCGTCRAALRRGEVHMDRNFALEDEERAAGYVLACQSHPLTPDVEIDFDV